MTGLKGNEVDKMKSRYVLRAVILAMFLSLVVSAAGQRRAKMQGAYPPGPCRQNPRVCVQNMNRQIGLMRAYVGHLKPGEKVIFNPQPDPPGKPAQQAMQAYRSLQVELSDLAGWSSENPTEKSHAAISDAQEKFGSLGRASERNSANTALSSLSSSVQRLSRVLR